jgi:hypothetical protein
MSPRVTIDTSEATSFEATEPGPYPMTIGTVEFKKSKESQQPMMNVGYVFENPDLVQKCGTVFRNYMLAGKGAGFTRDFLKAASGGAIDIPVGGTFDFDSDDIIGKHVVVQIGNREYEGKLQNEAERIISAS